MFEVPHEDFPFLAQQLGRGSAGQSLVDMVMSGNSRGRAFTKSSGCLDAALVYDNGLCVMAGPNGDASFLKECLAWLQNESGQDFFVLYPGQDYWIALLDASIDSSIKKVGRVAFTFDRNRFALHPGVDSLPPHFVLTPMNATSMEAAIKAYPWIEQTWKSQAHFERSGIGYCVLAGERVVSMCYSVFVSGSVLDADILTLKDFRRLGLGRATASAFVGECLERGATPGWDCFAGNEASHQLAVSLGFQPTAFFPVYSWNR